MPHLDPTDRTHIAPTGALRAAATFDVPVVAICGVVHRPRPHLDPAAAPTCPECARRADEATQVGAEPVPERRRPWQRVADLAERATRGSARRV